MNNKLEILQDIWQENLDWNKTAFIPTEISLLRQGFALAAYGFGFSVQNIAWVSQCTAETIYKALKRDRVFYEQAKRQRREWFKIRGQK